jgi:hypothetical protein
MFRSGLGAPTDAKLYPHPHLSGQKSIDDLKPEPKLPSLMRRSEVTWEMNSK